MKKIFLLFLLMLLFAGNVFAYAIRLYDEYGNRIGTYRKEGENYVLYDFYDKKVENPEDLIKNAPTQKTLKQRTQYFYDENLIPIGSFSTGFYPVGSFHHPIHIRRGGFYNHPMHIHPRTFHHHNSSPYIVRPSVNQVRIKF